MSAASLTCPQTWLRYLNFKKDADPHLRFLLFERGVNQLVSATFCAGVLLFTVLTKKTKTLQPRSYKLWHMYLTERADHCAHLSPLDPEVETTIGAFERAVGKLSKMPVLWEM